MDQLQKTSSAYQQANIDSASIVMTLDVAERSVGDNQGSGTGSNLPKLKNIQWEKNRRGGFEAWHTPDGVTHRKDKTYLGYVGKRLLAKWKEQQGRGVEQQIANWVEARCVEKGIIYIPLKEEEVLRL